MGREAGAADVEVALVAAPPLEARGLVVVGDAGATGPCERQVVTEPARQVVWRVLGQRVRVDSASHTHWHPPPLRFSFLRLRLDLFHGLHFHALL